MRSGDQRLQPRYPIATYHQLSALLDAAPHRIDAEVADLSLSGAGLRLADHRVLNGTRQFTLGLSFTRGMAGIDHRSECPVELVHVRNGPTNGHSHAGVRFFGDSEPFLRDLCRYLLDTHSQRQYDPLSLSDPSSFRHVMDSRRVRRLLVHCHRAGKQLRVIDTAGKTVGHFRSSSLSKTCFAGHLEALPERSLHGRGYCYLLLPSHNALYVMGASLIGQRGTQVAFEVPQSMLEGGVRRHPRVVSDEASNVSFEFLHPQLPGRFIRKQAREMGLGGLSFDLDVDNDLVVQGLSLDSAVLRLPSGHSIPCRCLIRHTYSKAGGGFGCGVEIVEFYGSGYDAWSRFVLRHANPQVEEATPETLDEAWQVLEDSGYLEEKPVELMRTQRASFVEIWSSLLCQRGKTRMWLYRTQDRVVGTACSSPIYSKTWLGHHLAVDREQSARLKLVVLSHMVSGTLLQRLASQRPYVNLLAYFDAQKSFNQKAWFDFFDAHRDSTQVDVRRMQLFDISLDDLPALCTETTVRRARYADLPRISQDLMYRDGPCVHDSFDFAEDKILLDSLRLTPDGRALERQRQIFVATDHQGELEGYAIAESCAPGANVFSLYNTCRIIVLPQQDSGSFAKVRDALFARAVEEYRRRNTGAMLFACGEGDAPPPNLDRASCFDAAAVRAIVGGELMPELIAHLNDQWAHR